MDEEFLKLLEEMANVKDFPLEHQNSGSFSNANHIWADKKTEELINYISDTSTPDDHTMPAYLKSQIINRVHQPDIQRIVNNPDVKRPISKQLELFFYSCKVACAVAAAFAIMITSAITKQRIQDVSIPSDNSLQWTQEDNRDAQDTKEKQGSKEKKLPGIAESFGKGSSTFTNWLQGISDTLLNERKTENTQS